MPEGIASVVSASDLERSLAGIRNAVATPAEGIFGPASVSWNINRESALFLAAGRAVLLQLAHPWVATAIAEHSRTLHDPIGRFHRTCQAMFSITFAPVDLAMATAHRLHCRHANVQGNLREAAGDFAPGSRYEANEVSALRWVYATLVDSAVLAYELVLPPLSPAERDAYYVESRRTAALFGIPRDALPRDWSDFRVYMKTTLESDTLAVTAAAREMAQELNAGAGLPVRTPFWYGALTTHLLPASLRDEFQLPCGDVERRSAERALRWLRRVYSHLPAGLRFVGPYNEARARLAGRVQPGLSIRLGNKLWIGQSSLFNSPREPAR
jgi:uncharacterized protein (DUF2236 family)